MTRSAASRDAAQRCTSRPTTASGGPPRAGPIFPSSTVSAPTTTASRPSRAGGSNPAPASAGCCRRTVVAGREVPPGPLGAGARVLQRLPEHVPRRRPSTPISSSPEHSRPDHPETGLPRTPAAPGRFPCARSRHPRRRGEVSDVPATCLPGCVRQGTTQPFRRSPHRGDLDRRLQEWARWGSNPRPSDYESPALTTELRARAGRLQPSSGAPGHEIRLRRPDTTSAGVANAGGTSAAQLGPDIRCRGKRWRDIRPRSLGPASVAVANAGGTPAPAAWALGRPPWRRWRDLRSSPALRWSLTSPAAGPHDHRHSRQHRATPRRVENPSSPRLGRSIYPGRPKGLGSWVGRPTEGEQAKAGGRGVGRWDEVRRRGIG